MEIHETNFVGIGRIGNQYSVTLLRYDAESAFYSGPAAHDSSLRVAIAKLEEAAGDNLALCEVRSFIGEYWGTSGKSVGIVADFS